MLAAFATAHNNLSSKFIGLQQHHGSDATFFHVGRIGFQRA